MHRFILEPYNGIKTRFQCPKCNKKAKFSHYIDTEKNERIHPSVGRCERIDKCGYHYTPKQYFQDNNVVFKDTSICNSFRFIQKEVEKPISFISKDLVQSSLKGYEQNNFIQYLISLIGKEEATRLANKYKVGTSRYWTGATVFWQIDNSNKARTGKIMLYDINTGKRVKKPQDRITWAHKALKKGSYNLSQCLFGEHLLNSDNKPIAIVESEKTAIISSAYLPQFTWLATGGSQSLKLNEFNALKNRDVFLFPDLGKAYSEWSEKAKSYSGSITVSNLLEKIATDEERKNGLDLADYLIRCKSSDFKITINYNY